MSINKMDRMQVISKLIKVPARFCKLFLQCLVAERRHEAALMLPKDTAQKLGILNNTCPLCSLQSSLCMTVLSKIEGFAG